MIVLTGSHPRFPSFVGVGSAEDRHRDVHNYLRGARRITPWGDRGGRAKRLLFRQGHTYVELSTYFWTDQSRLLHRDLYTKGPLVY